MFWHSVPSSRDRLIFKELFNIMKPEIEIMNLPHGEGLPHPSYETAQSAGMDLRAAIDGDVVIKPFGRRLIPTGYAIALPQGFEAQIRPRSGLALKQGLTVLNTPGTVDSDYRGELQVLLVNLSSDSITIERGMRIAQMVISSFATATFKPVVHFSQATDRGEKGWGSTGIHN